MLAVLRIAVVSLALAAALARAQDDLDVKPAMAAAQSWLATLDAGGSGAAWEAAAENFRESLTRVKWQTTMQTVREPLGVVLHRKLRSANYVRDPPGGPPGEYVMIQYDTHFENRLSSTEVVAPRKESDGTWKVAGYVIR